MDSVLVKSQETDPVIENRRLREWYRPNLCVAQRKLLLWFGHFLNSSFFMSVTNRDHFLQVQWLEICKSTRTLQRPKTGFCPAGCYSFFCPALITGENSFSTYLIPSVWLFSERCLFWKGLWATLSRCSAPTRISCVPLWSVCLLHHAFHEECHCPLLHSQTKCSCLNGKKNISESEKHYDISNVAIFVYILAVPRRTFVVSIT